MAVKIRLKRMGKIRQPFYRVVVVDSRKKRDGKVIEEIGKYHPKAEPSFMEVKSERVQYWLGVGAQPSEAVEVILKVTGDWQKFKGLPGAEGTLRTAEPKRDKTDIFNEALKDSANEPKAGAVTKKTAADKREKADKAEKKAEKKPTKKAESSESSESAEPAEAPAEEPAAEAKADVKPEVKAGEKAEVEADEKAEVKADEKAEVKADVKAEVKADVKAEVKADVKPEVKADVKPEA